MRNKQKKKICLQRMTGQACVRFTAAILTGLSSLESILLFWNFQAGGIGFVLKHMCCCFRNSSNERRESTNVSQTMKSFTLYRYIFLWSRALFFKVSVFTESLFIVVDSLPKPRKS